MGGVVKIVWRYFRFVLGYKLTACSRALVVVFFVLGFMSGSKGVFFAGVLAGFLLLAALLVNSFYPGSIEICTPHLSRLMEGRVVSISCTLKNNSRFNAYDLSLRFLSLPKTVRQISSERIGGLGSGESVHCRVQMYFDSRGIYELRNLRCYSTMPFNLFRRSYGVKNETGVMVYPLVKEIGNIRISSPSSMDFQNNLYTSMPGSAEEYLGSRVSYEIQSLRNIDSRAWARLTVPAEREYFHRSQNNAAIYLQTSMFGAAVEDVEKFESAVRVASCCAYTLSCMDYNLRFFGSCHSFCSFESSGRQNEFEKTIQLLSEISSSTDRPCAESRGAFKSLVARERVSVIFVVVSEQSCFEVLEECRIAKCPACVILVGEGLSGQIYKYVSPADVHCIRPESVYEDRVVVS